MEQEKQYYAFISYKSEDVEWAIWLQHELEHYHLPASFNGRTDIRQELRPVFRDIDELSTGNLPKQIRQALKNSQNLIVVCSPQAATSPWVNQEIKTFISLGRTDRIFPFIVEGNSPKEFFPPSLLALPENEERLGGDASKQGRDVAFVKVVAGMLGLGFDDLWIRYEREKAEKKRRQREEKEKEKQYYAFISYKSEDVEWAIWLQHELEHYHLPASFNGRTDIRQELRPVFRDIDELSTGNLPKQIRQALKNSQNLIVVCSPQAATSPWVNQEIKTFISLGRTDRIFPFIVEGNSPKEFFPPSLLALPENEERLGGDASKQGRDVAFVKVVAGMLGLGFDDLWNRYEREKAEEERKQREQRDKLLIAQSRFLAEKANQLIEEGDSYKAAILALEALPNINQPDRPITHEAVMVLSRALETEGTILECNSNNVEIYSFSNDEQFLVTSSNNELHIWDIYKGVCIYSEQMKNCVTAAVYCNSKQLLITAFKKNEEDLAMDLGKKDYFIRIKNVRTNESKDLKGHLLHINNLCLNSNGTLLLSTSDDNTIKIWDLEKFICLCTLEGHKKAISFASFSPNNKHILSTSIDRTVKIWDFQTAKLIGTLKGHKKAINYASYSNDEKYIVTASDDKTIRIWDNKTMSCQKILKGHSAAVDYSSFCIDDKHIISVSIDGTIRVWNLEKDKVYIKNMIASVHHEYVDNPKKHRSEMFYSAVSAISNILSYFNFSKFKLSPLDYCRLLWSFLLSLITKDNYSSTYRFNKAVARIGNLTVLSPKGNRVATNIDTDGIKIIKSRTITSVWVDAISLELYKEDIGYIRSASFSSSGEYAVMVIYGHIRIWETKGGSIVKTIGVNEIAGTSVYYAACSSDAHYVAATSMDQKVRVWNTHTGKCITIPHRSFTPFLVAFSMDDKYIVATSYDGEIKIWEVESGACISIITVNNETIRYVSFSPDNRYVLSASDKGSIKIWDVFNGKCVKELLGHKGRIHCAVFSPNLDEDIMLSASEDGTIKIWDWRNEKCIKTIESYASEVSFNSSGDSFISIAENQIKIWRSPNWDCVKTITDTSNIVGTWFNGEIIKSVSEKQIHKWHVPTFDNLFNDAIERFKERPLTLEERKQYYLE